MNVGAAARHLPHSDADHHMVEALYLAEASALARAERRRPGSDDPLDLVHDAFVRLIGLGSDRLDELEQQRPAAYLWRIARRLGLDRVKRDERRVAALHVPLDEALIPGGDLARQLEARDELRHVERAVLAMRPRTRAIFLAHRVDGMSYAEIARECGIGVKGVEKQMSRAIAVLARELDRLGDD
jgi:RNA polymerase sigma-70 factor (ECF subfamily)